MSSVVRQNRKGEEASKEFSVVGRRSYSRGTLRQGKPVSSFDPTLEIRHRDMDQNAQYASSQDPIDGPFRPSPTPPCRHPWGAKRTRPSYDSTAAPRTSRSPCGTISSWGRAWTCWTSRRPRRSAAGSSCTCAEPPRCWRWLCASGPLFPP